jgi:hypothetical protein
LFKKRYRVVGTWNKFLFPAPLSYFADGTGAAGAAGDLTRDFPYDFLPAASAGLFVIFVLLHWVASHFFEGISGTAGASLGFAPFRTIFHAV